MNLIIARITVCELWFPFLLIPRIRQKKSLVFSISLRHEGAIKMFGFTIQQLMTLLRECPNYLIFGWSGKYYEQEKVLLLRRQLAPSLAIALIPLHPGHKYQ